MKISDMILKLNDIRDKFGDLPMGGGYLAEDTPPRRLIVLDRDSCVTHDPSKAVEVFIE